MLRFDKFTIKAQEALLNAKLIAENYSHQQIEPIHIIKSIIDVIAGKLNLSNLAFSFSSVLKKG